jgi:hypothetical protein
MGPLFLGLLGEAFFNLCRAIIGWAFDGARA